MRKTFLFVLSAVFVASVPALAVAAAKKKQADPTPPGARLVRDGVSQIFVPAQSIAAASQPKPAAKTSKKKKQM